MLLKKSILALTLTTALLATSCAAPKKTVLEQHSQTHSSLSHTTTEESHREDIAAIRAERLLNEWLAMWLRREETTETNTERVTEIYDTTQPPDSTTGTPPLAARIREKHEAKSRSDSHAKAETSGSDSAATEYGAHSMTDTATQTETEAETSGESETDSREEKGTDKSLVWISIAVSLLSLAVIAIVIKHRSNNR